jgi:SAM-dependent methyltransferase
MNRYVRLNVGCGRTPTAGWTNLDNSFSIKLARMPWLTSLLRALRVLKSQQIDNINYLQSNHIQFCDARKRIPVSDGAADVVYASHMVEHLDRDEASMFFAEAKRVLIPGGTIRLALPNLRWHIDNYLVSGDGDEFMVKTKLGRRLPKSLVERAALFFFGEREYHAWMYDCQSAVKLLQDAGFTDVRTYPPGKTRISSPGALNLAERVPESLFVEGSKQAVSATSF